MDTHNNYNNSNAKTIATYDLQVEANASSLSRWS